MKSPTILRDLGDHLILRRATPDDADTLAEFNALIHTDEPGQPDKRIASWTKDLITKPHPTFSPGDFTIVEDTSTRKIVSSLNLISQTWSYAGIPFKVGRPELVGTLPEYRNRGLVRAQFEVIHQWSAERGEMAQGITGIQYYYRLFGYEMALNLSGGRAGYLLHIHDGRAEGLAFHDTSQPGEKMIQHEGTKIKYTTGAYAGQIREAEMGPKAFGALFFFITGFHGFHVFSGVLFLAIIMINAASGLYAARRNGYEMVEKMGLYWHFVDLVWVFVFLVFYLL